MQNGFEKFDIDLLNTLKQNFQLFFNSKNGGIDVFVIISSDNVEKVSK